MDDALIEKSIEIDASPAKVWAVFTDPSVTRQMGGEYVSDWKAGSSFGWKGQDGNMYTSGEIIRIKPEILLQHKLFDLSNRDHLLSVISYEFEEKKGKTILTATEELNYSVTEQQLADISEGWDYALNAVKEIAEK